MAGPGEVQDPRLRALLLGGGTAVGAAPFVASAIKGSLDKKSKANELANRQAARKAKLDARFGQATPAAGRGGLSTLGRFAGPAGAVAGMVVPSGNMAGPEATMLRPNETYSDPVLQRTMFSGQAPKADGQGITSGLETSPEQEAQMEEVMGDMSGMMQSMAEGIDNASDYAGIMNAIRGDEQSIDQRRGELAQLIGKSDAEKTPESALTLIQPSLTLLEATDQGSPDSPEPVMDEDILSALGKAGEQGEALARMEMGEQPVKMFKGGLQNDAQAAMSFPGDPVAFAPTQTGTSQQQLLSALVQGLPQPKTSAELLPQYQELYKDSAKAYELNPYIAGLNLAAAVANAPEGELISSILAPETIKAVSDPILQMAQARGQGDLLAKKAAMERAATESSDYKKSIQAYTTAAIPKMFEKGKITTQTIGNQVVVIDEDALRAANAAGTKYQPLTVDGKLAPNFQVTRLSDTQWVTTDKNTGASTVGGDQKTTWKEITTQDGDIIFVDANRPSNYQVISEGGGQILGDAKDGFFRLKDGVISQVNVAGYTPPGDLTERMKEARRFGELQAAAKAGTMTIAETGELEVLTKALIPAEDKTEFEAAVDQYITGYKTSIIDAMGEGTDETYATARANEVRQLMLYEYIQAKTTKPGGQYDPEQSLKKAASTSLLKAIDGVNETAQVAANLASQAQVVAELSGDQGFRGGQLGSARLTVLNLAKEMGIENLLEKQLGIDDGTLEDFFGGNPDVGRVQEALGEAMVVSMAGAFPGNLNQTEIDILKSAALGIGKTPGANKLLADTLTAISERQTKVAQELNTFISGKREGGADSFELKLAYDIEKSKLDAKYADPETNSVLQNLRERADALSDRTDDISGLAGTYPDTAALEADYQNLMNRYPNIFPTLPARGPNRQAALERALDFIGR